VSGTAIKERFERFLRAKGWPFVAVDEAARALFGGVRPPRMFDFLVHAPDGPNLLCLLQPRPRATEADRKCLTEWRRIFGDGFDGCIVWTRRDQFRAATVTELDRGAAIKDAAPIEELVDETEALKLWGAA